MNNIHSALAKAGFVRSNNGKLIGGVCSGLASKFGVDVWAMRLVFFLLMVVVPGSPLLLYPIAWILMPDETFPPQVQGGSTYPQDRLSS